MWKDPIVAEIHAIREQLAKECDYDLKRIMDRLRQNEKEHKERVVHKSVKEITTGRISMISKITDR